MQSWILTSDEIAYLKESLESEPFNVQVAVDYSGFKIKFNHTTWSPPMGKKLE